MKDFLNYVSALLSWATVGLVVGYSYKTGCDLAEFVDDAIEEKLIKNEESNS